MKGFFTGLRGSSRGYWVLLAVALLSMFATTGCNDYGNTFQAPTGASVSSLSPGSVSAGSAAFTISINGGGFVSQTVVQWNGKNLPTTVTLDPSGSGAVLSVTAQVSATLVSAVGTAAVNTLNPASGAGENGLSNTITFIINPPANPVPTISSTSQSINPITAGSSFLLTITGTNFLNASGSISQVNWNEGATQTTLANPTITSTQIQVTVTAAVVTKGCAVVTVFNPPSQQTTPAGQVPNPSSGGGGTSNGVSLIVGGGTCPGKAGTQSAASSASSSSVVSGATQETPAINKSGRYAAYAAVDQDGISQIYERDTCLGAASGCQPNTLLISAAPDGTAGNDDSHSPSLSADGRYVAFSSAASNLVSGAPAGRQVYLRDTCLGAPSGCAPSTQLVSTDSNGALLGTEAILPSVSGSGRFVAFLAVTPSATSGSSSSTTSSGSSGTNGAYTQVFVRDTCIGATGCTPSVTRISLQPGDGTSSNGNIPGPALSKDASQVAIAGPLTTNLFTSGTTVDDGVFLSLTGYKQ